MCLVEDVTEQGLVEKARRELLELGYTDSSIVREFKLTENLRPDLVVLDDLKRPLIVVEVKALLHMPLAKTQLELYLRESQAKYGILTDGISTFYYGKLDSGDIVEIPEIPGLGKTLQDIHRPRLKPLKSPAYKFWRIANILRSERLPVDIQIRELEKLLICKVFDEDEDGSTGLFWPPPGLLSFETVGEQMKSRFGEIFRRAKERYPDLFEDRETISLSYEELARIVQELASYSIRKNPASFAKGFEVLVDNGMRSMGQYSTPRILSRFLVEVLRPAVGESLIDPACGTGGILLGFLEYIRQNYPSMSLGDYARQRLYGIDIEKNIVLVAKMNMILHGVEHPNIFLRDALGDLPAGIQDILATGGFDIVVVDPPLAGISTRIKGYELGKDRRTQLTHVLFLERAIQLARIGGRIGIIVPDNLLFADNAKRVRSFILKNAFIRSIVSLPLGAYSPYLRGRTSALILEKKDPRQDYLNYDVFMAEANTEESLEQIATAFKKATTQAFTVKASQLQDRWDVGYYISPAPVNGRPLGELLLRIKRGISIPSRNYSNNMLEGTAPYIRILNIDRGKIVHEDLKYVPARDTPERAVLKANQVLLSVRGSLGKVAVVNKDFEGAIASSQIVILEPDERRVSPFFLARALSSKYVKAQITRAQTGALIKHLPISELRKLRIRLPPLDKQKAAIERIQQFEKEMEASGKAQEEGERRIERILEES